MDTDPDMTFDGEVEGSYYGFLKEVCGDIDGDKVNDLIIGASLYGAPALRARTTPRPLK